jgi:hypothetical protein
MRHAHIVANARLPHHQTWGCAFGEGLKRHGWRVTHGGGWSPCDMAVFWGIRQQDWIDAQKRAGGEVCILERGYVGDRMAWTSVSFGGGLNGRGEFRGPHHDGSRWERHFAHLMHPWRQADAGVALVMGQVPGDNSIRGVDIERWYRQAEQAYRARGWTVRFRPHPHGRTGGTPLQEDLSGAGVAVTYNSNSATDGILSGTPTVACDKGSMAWHVAGHELGAMPPTPDRMAWAHRLAWCQWTRDEMVSGECWAAVGAS